MPRGPEPIRDILTELMARRGFARVQSSAALESAWSRVAGELMSKYTRVGAVKRGKLEIVVANSTLVQEMTFQKQSLLAALKEALPDESIKDLRFRVGAIC